MAEHEEQELIPATEAGQDETEAAQELTEKPDEDDGGYVAEDGAEQLAYDDTNAAEEYPLVTDQQQEELPPEEYPATTEETQLVTEEEGYMADTVVEVDVPAGDEAPTDEQPAEVPADGGEGDIAGELEAALIEREAEAATEQAAATEKEEELTDMQALEQNLTQFRHCIENIGTQLDDEMNRQDMRKLRASIRKKATRMENDLKERQLTKDKMEPQERIHLQQVIKQLDNQLTTYHELLERERAMTRRYPLVGTTIEQEERAADQAATPSQAQAMLRNNVREREQEQTELMELERDILGLHDIQTDLATLIGEQAGDIQLIEQNVERAGQRVEHGHNQMQQSVGLSRGNRKMYCVVGTIVALIVVLVVAAAVVTIAVILAR